jgi:hypothetical protein
MRDPTALAAALDEALSQPTDRKQLMEATRLFEATESARNYLRVLNIEAPGREP